MLYGLQMIFVDAYTCNSTLDNHVAQSTALVTINPKTNECKPILHMLVDIYCYVSHKYCVMSNERCIHLSNYVSVRVDLSPKFRVGVSGGGFSCCCCHWLLTCFQWIWTKINICCQTQIWSIVDQVPHLQQSILLRLA